MKNERSEAVSNTNQMKENFKFAWRIVAAHVIAYFIAGILAQQVLHYGYWFSNGVLSLFMRPTSAPIIAIGPCFQVLRGIIMALVFLPFRKIITEGKYGFLKMGFLILGLSVFSTFAAATGSVDGFIYTIIPFIEHIKGYPEALLLISLFTGILWIFYKYEKKVLNIIAIVLCALIFFFCTAGYLDALQK